MLALMLVSRDALLKTQICWSNIRQKSYKGYTLVVFLDNIVNTTWNCYKSWSSPLLDKLFSREGLWFVSVSWPPMQLYAPNIFRKEKEYHPHDKIRIWGAGWWWFPQSMHPNADPYHPPHGFRTFRKIIRFPQKIWPICKKQTNWLTVITHLTNFLQKCHPPSSHLAPHSPFLNLHVLLASFRKRFGASGCSAGGNWLTHALNHLSGDPSPRILSSS